MAAADLAAHKLAHGVRRVAPRRLAAGVGLLPRGAARRGDAEAHARPVLVVGVHGAGGVLAVVVAR